MTKHIINIKGPIISNDEAWIYEMFEMDGTSPRMVAEGLAEANGGDIIVSINSPGGNVDGGSEIYTALKNYTGHVEVQIVGWAASAASVIAMAGDTVRISPTGQVMIHNAATRGGYGDHRLMEKYSQRLRNTDESIVNAYVLKTGKSQDELLAMMADETWMNAKQALDHKFADEIMFMDNPVKLVATSFQDGMIPQKVIDGIRNKVMNEKSLQTNKPKENKGLNSVVKAFINSY